MNYDDMDAGLKLDALVAEKVMRAVPCGNWKHFHAGEMSNDMSCGHVSCYPPGCVPPYSSVIGWAWQVVEKLGRMGINKEGPDCYVASLKRNGQLYGAMADSAPLAICMAALKAVT